MKEIKGLSRTVKYFLVFGLGAVFPYVGLIITAALNFGCQWDSSVHFSVAHCDKVESFIFPVVNIVLFPGVVSTLLLTQLFPVDWQFGIALIAGPVLLALPWAIFFGIAFFLIELLTKFGKKGTE